MLKDKIALITGASQGIGKAIAERFAEEGASLILCARSEEKLKKVALEIEKKGARVLTLTVNVSEAKEVEDVTRKSLDNYGRIDILVNNAGLTRDNLMLRMSEYDWQQVLDTNLKGTFLFTKSCAKGMIKNRWGRIINIASIIGVIGNAGQANYAASKAGIIGLTKSAAKELASRNITVNAIAPGFIQTAMTDALPDAQRETLLKQIPLGKFGEGKHVADAALFLASSLADYITGQVIRVDGGMVI